MIPAPSFRPAHAVSSALIGLLVALLVLLSRTAGYLEPFELLAYDYYQSLKVKGTKPDSSTVLITITEDDIQRLGSWPLSDATLSKLIEKLEQHKPAVIGLDIYRDIPVPPGSAELVRTFSLHSNIIVVKKLGSVSEGGVPRPYAVGTDDIVGANDIVTDRDGTVRRGLLFLDDGDSVASSFPFLMAATYLAGKGIVPEPGIPNPDHVRLGKTTFIPLGNNDGGYRGIDARGYQLLLDLQGLPFTSYSLSQVMRDAVPGDALSGKILIVGTEAQSIKDNFFTPLDRFSGRKFTYGVELHALLTSQLLRSAAGESRPLASWKEYQEWAWIIGWGVLGIILGLGLRSMSLLVTAMAVSLGVLAGATWWGFTAGWWLPVVPPALSCLLSASGITSYLSYRERADRRVLMQLFSKHVSRDVAEALWDQRDRFMTDGMPLPQKLTATVLFTDLRGFTTISERLEPQALMGWLNEYMEAMATIISAHNGVINKYIGDAIMAVFGVPVASDTEEEQRRDAVRAVACAVAMAKGLTSLNSGWLSRGLPSVGMRIGIFTGPLVAGCLGSEERMEYTVIGDTVNIASRLESFGKGELPADAGSQECRILIGEDTLRCLGDAFLTLPVGEVSLKGREGKTTIHLVTGWRGEAAIPFQDQGG